MPKRTVILALAALLGACQAGPAGLPGTFATQGHQGRHHPTSPARPTPQPGTSAPVGARPHPHHPPHKGHPRRTPGQPRPTPGRTPNPYYPGYPGDWRSPDPDGRLRRDVTITRVWTTDVGSDHLTVHWTTDQPTVGLVEWGTADFDDHSDWEMTPDTYHTADVTDLAPDTEYRFRVLARARGGAGVWSPELRERTAP